MRRDTPGPRRGRWSALGAGLAAALSLATAAAAEEPRHLTLDEALAIAEDSPLAAAAALELDRARAEERAAGLWPNPELSYDHETSGLEEERLAAVSLALPLSGRLGLERLAARRAVAASEGRARQERVERRVRVREAFLDLLAAQERDRLLAEALGDIDALVRTLRTREAEGETSGYDRMRAEQEQADLSARRLERAASLARARSALAALLGLAPGPLVAEGSLDATRTPLPTIVEAEAGAASRGDVGALDADAEARDLLGRAAARRAVPEPALWAGRKTGCAASVCETGFSFGISVSLPVFDRGQAVRSAFRAEAEIARARRAALALEARADAQAALAEARSLREAEAALAGAPPPDRLVAIARAAYGVGEMRIFELLDAYRTALATRLRATEVRLAARRAEEALRRATGGEPLTSSRP